MKDHSKMMMMLLMVRDVNKERACVFSG